MRSALFVVLLLFVAVVGACGETRERSASRPRTCDGGACPVFVADAAGDASHDAGRTDASDGGGAVPDGSEPERDAPPTITSFAASTDAITEGEALTFTLRVDDPDGLGDLLVARLRSPDGRRYGVFVVVGPGELVLETSWSAIDAIVPIDALGPRTFVAEVFDAAGASAEAELEVTLDCHDVSPAGVCGGACVALNVEGRCGGCGLTCPTEVCSGSVCQDASCSELGACVATLAVTEWTSAGTSCRRVCAAATPPGACNAAWSARLGAGLVAATCDSVPTFDRAIPSEFTISSITCVCATQFLAKGVGQSCAATCASVGDVCRAGNDPTIVTGVFTGGAGTTVADTCGPPYTQPVDWRTARPGDRVIVHDQETALVCACAVPPR